MSARLSRRTLLAGAAALPTLAPTLFDTHRLGAASDVYLKGYSGRDDK